VDKFSPIEDELQRRESRHQLRKLKTVTPLSAVEVLVNGRVMVNFSSNDYLGLSKHPLLRERAGEFMENYGTGAAASRLISGSYDCFDRVEEKLAELAKTESALIFPSGFQANATILPALADPDALILSDRLNHNSIIQGTRLSRCQKILYDHNDLQQLASLLETHHNRGYSRIIIVTESLFSMDGDRSDVDALSDLSETYHAFLMIDDAHASGVLGINGMGLACGKGVDVAVGTFSKALGSLGGYAACSKQMREYLVNCCSGFIYSTALSPPVLGAIDAALDLIPEMEEERKALQDEASFLRVALEGLGFITGNSASQIIPVIVGGEGETLALSKKLDDAGYLATAIRPPTVPEGESRIRLTLSTAHTREHTEGLIEVFRRDKNG